MPDPIRRLRPLSPSLALAALALALASPARAQNTGAVIGQVVDQAGEPFGFVDVFLEQEDGTYQEAVLADDEGKFAFRPVPTGTFSLFSYAAGFTSTKYENLVVTPNRTQRFTLTLRPEGEFQEEVTVNAALLGMVDTRKTEVSTTLQGEFIEAIPLQNKRIQDIVALFAGVTRNGSSDSSDISVAGGNSNQIGYRLNGISINDPVDGGALLDISTGAIADFKLIAGGFNAEYGEQSTGIAEIVTRSGTNEVTWAYEVNWRDSDVGAQAVGGGLEAVQQFWDDTFNARGTLLFGEVQDGFRLLGIDPVSTRADDNDPPPRRRIRHTMSTGGPIVRDKVFMHVTVENLQDDNGNPFVDGTTYTNQTLLNTKVDWQVSENNKLVLTADTDVSNTSGFASFAVEESADRDFTAGTYQLAAVDTHVFDPETILETRFSAVRNYAAGRPKNVRTGVGTQYVIPMPPGGFVDYIAGDAFADSDQVIDSFRLESSLTKIYGEDSEHEMKFGASFQQSDVRLFVDQGAQVSDFRITNDRSIFAPPTTVGREITFGPARRTDDASWAASVFVQDRWRVTENLTLDLGLRGDYQDFVGDLFLAPRFGFSLDPIGDGRTRFFGNWGIFYDNLFTNALQHEAQPDRLWADIINSNPQTNDLRFGDISIADIYKEALNTRPGGSDDPEEIVYLNPLLRDRYVLSDNLTAPTNKAWSIGLERRLPAAMRLQVTYQEARRTHQLLTFARTVREPQEALERQIREIVLDSSGQGQYRQWTVELQRPFSNSWQANISYTQSKNIGPLAPPTNPLDPFDVLTEQGLLGNDRTHVVKLQGRAKLPWKLDMSADFTWQSGRPVTATIITPQGQTIRPLGRNTLRLPSTRQLNFGLKRAFQTADGKLTIAGELQFFNLLNEFNVFGGLGRFELPPGVTDPLSYPPLRPTVIPTGIDVSRSMELGLRISF